MGEDRKLRFGLVAAGWMAEMCCEAMPEVSNAEIAAVYARNPEKGAAFAKRHSIPRHTDHYRDILDDSSIDAIYITSTNESHAPLAFEAIEAGKAVLMEKPFALDFVEAKAVVDAAERRGVLIMDALWSRFVPGADLLVKTLQSGVIGDPRSIRMRQGFAMTPEKNARVFDPEKGGGVLLDISVYPLSILEMLTGRLPGRVENKVVRHPSGVDIRNEITLRYEGGLRADIYVTCEENFPEEMVIVGDKGELRTDRYVFPKKITVNAGGSVKVLDAATSRNQYVFQLEHFASLFKAGAVDSDILPLARMLRVMRMIDMCREAEETGTAGVSAFSFA